DTLSSLHSSRHPPPLPSFPTRRSSDLRLVIRAGETNLQTDIIGLGGERGFVLIRRLVRPTGGEELFREMLPQRHILRRLPQCFRSEEHTSELQSRGHLVCRLLLEKNKE